MVMIETTIEDRKEKYAFESNYLIDFTEHPDDNKYCNIFLLNCSEPITINMSFYELKKILKRYGKVFNINKGAD